MSHNVELKDSFDEDAFLRKMDQDIIGILAGHVELEAYEGEDDPETWRAKGKQLIADQTAEDWVDDAQKDRDRQFLEKLKAEPDFEAMTERALGCSDAYLGRLRKLDPEFMGPIADFVQGNRHLLDQQLADAMNHAAWLRAEVKRRRESDLPGPQPA